MATIKLGDKNEKKNEDYILASTSEQANYIEKFDAEVADLTFSPTTDTSKAKAVAISDAYSSSVFSAISYTPLVTLDASSRNNPIHLIGNAQKNTIIGGKGADTLTGGDGADNLTGGSGADIFISSAGKDVIADYSPADGDIIKLNNITPTKVAVSKQNVVITSSDGSAFTINDAKGKKLNVVDANGKVISSVSQIFGETDLVYSGTDTSTIDATFNTVVKNIDASNASVDGGIKAGSLLIIGSSKVNSIVGSNFVGSNTLEAGAGNDTLTGGSGSITETLTSSTGSTYKTYYVHNTYVFAEGQGKNVITNYQSGLDQDEKAIDSILLRSGTVTGYTTKGNDITFTIALNGKKATTLTVINGKNKLITFLQPDGTIDNVNTKIYRNVTDYVVTTQTHVSTSLTNVNDKLSDSVKLIDASTDEYSTVAGYNGVTPIAKNPLGVYIEGNKAANTIIGSRFSDTITGGVGKDTLSGGHSSVDAASPYYDTFLYYSGTGNKIITDYIGTSDTGKSDIIKLAPDTTISTSVLNTKKGATDVVLTLTNEKGKNKGTLTLNGTQDKLVTIVRQTDTLGGEETIAPQKYGNTSLKVGADIYPIDYKDSSNNVTLGVVDTTFNAKVVTIDGSSADEALYLIGNSGKNSIIGSKTKSNTLKGGAGNDTLSGMAGVVDTFVFDTVDGTDAIVDFEPGTDVIKMASTDVHVTASTLVTSKGANDVQLTIGKSKVLIKGIVDTMEGTNAKGKAVTLYNAPKITIDRGDGTHYKMTYANELAKIEDGDVEDNGILDFTSSALIATIDAGSVILDGKGTVTLPESVAAAVGDSVSVVAVSSTDSRTKNLGIIGSAKANTIIGATKGSKDMTTPVTTITGGKGNDVFIQPGGGDMIITDYNTNAKNEADAIVLLSNQVLNSSKAVSDTSKDLLLLVDTTLTSATGSGSADTVSTVITNHITIEGGLEKTVTIVDSDGKSNSQQFGQPIIRINDKSSTNILADGGVKAVVDDGRKKAISITSTSARDSVEGNGISIQGGNGNDTLNGGPSTGGVSTLTGGNGNDIFMHNSGKFAEVITDYQSSKDKLEFIQGMEIASITASNDSDIVLHFTTISYSNGGLNETRGYGHITVAGGLGRKISIAKEREETYYDSKSKTNKTRMVKDETTQIFKATEIEVVDADGATIDASDGANNDDLQVVNASNRSAKKPITIIGNARVPKTSTNPSAMNNTLIGGKGNDTIYTSYGSNSATDITGNAGADTFIYRGGNVTIEDYTWNKKTANSDVIVLASDTWTSMLANADLEPTIANVNNGKVTFSGEDVIFTFKQSQVSISGGGYVVSTTDSLTLKNAKDKNIAIVDATGATISSESIYANPYEWTITNKTDPTTLKAVYIDASDTAYNAISASARTKADTIEAGYAGGKATISYIVTGGKGADFLIGNEVVGTLVGGNGNDTLRSRGGGTASNYVGASANYLTGGVGKDVFYYSPSTSSEYDIITDYEVGKDVLRLPEGYYVESAEVTSLEYDQSKTRQTTLTGVQASLSADGVWEVVKNKNKTVAKNLVTTANDVVLTIANSKGTVGTVTVLDAGGYSSMVDTSAGVSLAAIGAYKISIASESTNAKGKTVVDTSSLDLVSSEVVVVNADGTTIDVSANANVVNIVPSVKPARSKAMYVIGNAKANSIEGTAKADTLAGGGASNGIDTLTGGNGIDVFMLDGKGDVLISDYTSAKGNFDKIRLGANVTLDNGEAVGNDLKFTYKFGTEEHYATVVGAAATKITLVSSDGQAGSQVYGSESIEVANADGTKVDVGSNKNVKSIDSSKRSKAVWLIGNNVTSTILGGKGHDTLDSSKLTISDSIKGAFIDAGNGNDVVYGSEGADSVTLGAGNDTFITGGGDDTVETGKGKDVIIYNGGKMVITDLDAKNDRLELQATINTSSYGNQNISLIDYTIATDATTVILNLGYNVSIDSGTNYKKSETDTITILNGVDKNLLLTNATGKTDTLTLSDPQTLKVTNSDGANISPSSMDTITSIDATKRSDPVNIKGSEDTILIKGGTKADTITLTSSKGGTIQGGKGDDTLSGTATLGSNDKYTGGNAGKMFYAYTTGDGKDVITNYNEGDVIVLGSAKTTVNEAKSKVTGNDYVLTIGSGSITFKNCANTEIKVQAFEATTTTTYNQQSTTSPYMEYLVDEIFTDDNFVDTTELTEIIQTAPITTEQPMTNIESTLELSKSSTLAAGTDK